MTRFYSLQFSLEPHSCFEIDAELYYYSDGEESYRRIANKILIPASHYIIRQVIINFFNNEIDINSTIY